MKRRVYLSIDKRTYDGALQLSIGAQDEDGGGTGYRIAGPKYDGDGTTLVRRFLTERDKQEILSYLKMIEA